MESKKCTKCGEVKVVSEFYLQAGSAERRQGTCKLCVTSAQKARRAANPEKARAVQRARYAANPEKARAVRRAHRAANLEQERAVRRARYAANPEKASVAHKLYRETHKEVLSAKNKKYRELQSEQLSARRKAQYGVHREEELAGQRKRYADNREARCAAARVYAFAHREEDKARSKAYRAANPERARAAVKSWLSANPERRAAYGAKRKANKLQATPFWSNEFFIAEAYHLAKLRTKLTGVKWHVDHSVPLKSKLVSGLHNEFNLRVIPAKTNISKGNRTWPGMPTELPANMPLSYLRERTTI